MRLRSELRHWAGGIRLYIAITIGLISLQVTWWGGLVYAGTPDLMWSRIHEVYGWLALLWLAAALAIGPAYKILPGLPGQKPMRDARRMVGIGAAWFALLHAAIAYGYSLKAINPLQLATSYQRAFLVGCAALIILAALALTSFNGAMRGLGRWWFRLHRLIYVAAGLAVWHAFMIGVHAVSPAALAVVIGAAIALFIGHVHLALLRPRPSRWQIAALAVVFLAIVVLSNYGIQQYINHNSLGLGGHLH